MYEPVIRGGYILLARRILESDIWEKPPLYLKVWIYILSKAQHKEYRQLSRGQLWCTISEIQKACKYKKGYITVTPSYKEVRDAIDWLRKPDESIIDGITEGSMIVTTKGTQGILITIDKYNFYQNPRNYEGHEEGQDEKPLKVDRRSRQGHNINKNDKNVKNAKYIFLSDSTEYILAEYFFSFIKRNNEKAKEPNMQSWAKQFEYIIRIDKRDVQEVKHIIEFSQNHSFWYKNILGPDKLRKQYDRLLLEINSKGDRTQLKQQERPQIPYI